MTGPVPRLAARVVAMAGTDSTSVETARYFKGRAALSAQMESREAIPFVRMLL